MSAFLNPVRAADNIGASPDKAQEFDNGDDHPDKHDGDHCDDYDDDDIGKGKSGHLWKRIRWTSTYLKVFSFLAMAFLASARSTTAARFFFCEPRSWMEQAAALGRIPFVVVDVTKARMGPR